MSKELAIGGHVKLAFDDVNKARRLGPSNPQAVENLFYALGNLLLATMVSEDKSRPSNIMDMMVDKEFNFQSPGPHLPWIKSFFNSIPEECWIIGRLRNFSVTTPFPDLDGAIMFPFEYIQNPPEKDLMLDWIEESTALVKSCMLHFQVNIKEDPPKAGLTSPFRSGGHDIREPNMP